MTEAIFFFVGTFVMWIIVKLFFNVKLKVKHKCSFDVLLFDIPRNNETNHLIEKCKCGKIEEKRVHRKSDYYKKYKKNNDIRTRK